MSVVTISINGKNFQIGCNDGQEELVIKAAEKLDKKLSVLKKASPVASTELLLIMCALGLQDDNSTLRSQLGQGENPDSEKVSDTLSTIAGYLEDLANKISK